MLRLFTRWPAPGCLQCLCISATVGTSVNVGVQGFVHTSLGVELLAEAVTVCVTGESATATAVCSLSAGGLRPSHCVGCQPSHREGHLLVGDFFDGS